MLVRFTSTEAESITMFGDVALQLIKMLDASGRIPSAIAADELLAATDRLRQNLLLRVEQDEGDDKGGDTPVALATRAVPLLDILTRAGATRMPVRWDVI